MRASRIVRGRCVRSVRLSSERSTLISRLVSVLIST